MFKNKLILGLMSLILINICSNLSDMSQENLIQLKNKETGETYWSRRNKRITETKLEIKKFSKKLKKMIVFKQSKK